MWVKFDKNLVRVDVKRFAWRLRYLNGSVSFSLVSCEFEDDNVPDAIVEPDVAEMNVKEFLRDQSAAVLLKAVSLSLL